MTPETPLISTIIPVYNRDRYLEASVKSVIATNYPQLEVILVDDGSTDNSWELAKSLAKEYPNIVLSLQHSDKKNHGISETRNLGIHKSKGEIICFLDSDDIYLPCRFDYAVHALKQNPDLLAVYEPSAYAEDSPNFGDPDMDIESLIKQPIHGEFDRDQVFKGLINQYSEYSWVIPGITLRRNAFIVVGLFNTHFRVGEDTHLWIRLASTTKVICAQDKKSVAIVRRHSDHSWDSIADLDRHYLTLQVFVDAYNSLPISTDNNFNSSELLSKRITALLIEYLKIYREKSDRQRLIYLAIWGLFNWSTILRERLFWGNLIYGLLRL